MAPRVPERHKQAGVCYAVTDDGIELPVIDITHPAFRYEPSEADLAAMLAHDAASAQQWQRRPAFVRELVLRLILRRGAVTGSIVGARDSYLSGLATYLMKMGPENLGRRYTTRLDRAMAARISGASVRLRLQSAAGLMADGLAPALEAHPGRSVTLLNIAGGPCPDSLNALLLLRQSMPAELRDRSFRIVVLDRDSAGPSFGSRCLAALTAPGAPLHGVDVTWERLSYDWDKPAPLAELLASATEPTVWACSSEGGLFEYGTDAAIAANLLALAAAGGMFVVGSVTRGDEPARLLTGASQLALKPRALSDFEAVVHGAGWRLERTVACPLCWNVLLRPA